MSEPSTPGSSRQPSARIAIPPRTLPLDETNVLAFDYRQIPFSPTSPGKKSPGRPKTMKEYEEDLVNLKRENFNLKVRIYFMEQSRFDPNVPKDIDELRNSYTDLKVEFELQKKDLANKEDLLLNTYRALDAQKQQLEAMKVEHEAEKQELQSKIDTLERDLKEFQMKFMETSVQLDDTHAMYAITFGLNSQSESKAAGNNSAEKIKELENDLSKEKERMLMLEDMVARLNEKSTMDQKALQQLSKELEETMKNLTRAMQEKEMYEESVKEAKVQLTKLESIVQRRNQTIKLKDSEIESLRTFIEDMEKKIASMRLQEKEDLRLETTLSDRHVKSLIIENTKLKEEIKQVQQKLERRSSSRSQERQQALKLKESQLKVEELQKEVVELKNTKAPYRRDVERLIQTLFKENKVLKKEVEQLKTALSKHRNTQGSTKEEGSRNLNETAKEMTSEKDELIAELKRRIEELTDSINEKECMLQEYKKKLASSTNDDQNQAKSELDPKSLQDNLFKNEKENEFLTKELEERGKEVEYLKKELKKRTYNLQGLVNTELWDKNREIEKLNKLCERQHLDVLALQKQLREYHVGVVQDKMTSYVALQGSLFTEDKENMQPVSDPVAQAQQLTEEKRLLVKKVEELQARLLNTPERDTESLLVQNLRAERDQAEKLRKEAVNACMLLTTRLQELADFLESLLPLLCGRKRKVVQQAVDRSRELSRSLSVAAEESSVLQCSTWSDLQPSLHVPLLPDISTVDFWSGDEEEAFSEGDDAQPKAPLKTVVEEDKQEIEELIRFSSENIENPFLKPTRIFDDHCSSENIENNKLMDEVPFYGNLEDISEGSLVETCSDQNVLEKTEPNKLSPEVKSVNIGKITLTSKKKEQTEETKMKEKGSCASENDTWSEPDRDVSYARMGLKEESTNVNKSLQFNFDDTSETADQAPRSPLSRRTSEIQRLQRKIRSLEQVNEALRSELVILHQLAPPAFTRQDKATSIELSRQSMFPVPSHLLEEIRNQREKLEASLFHNDYIRRQLESTASSLRKSQGEDQEKASPLKLKEVTNKLEIAENELSELKLQKEEWNKKIEMLETTLKQNANDLIEKQCALLDLESTTSQRLEEVEDKYKEKCSQIEQKCSQFEQKWLELQKEKEQLVEKLVESDKRIQQLTAEIESYVEEGKKAKQLQQELNLQLQQTYKQKDELQRVVKEQEQLLADAERERQELATQLIARDRQVSELEKRLSHMELTSNELEAALRSQLDIATHQCAQFESKLRELDKSNKRQEDGVADLQRRLDSARFAHSEAVLQYTRVANENIKLQQELRRHQHEPNVAQVERIKSELERRVAELEAANVELETRLASLNIVRPLYSDCDADGGSSRVGSPRRPCPPPLVLPSSPPCYTTQRSNDLTSDYLSDQDAVLPSPKTHSQNLWFGAIPQPHTSASPDLGIESDHGHFSSLETQSQRAAAVALRGAPVQDLMKLEEENTQLRRNLEKTRHALEETLAQLTAANQHKRQYEAKLSAATHQNAKVERAICRQLYKTQSILKKARVNLEEEVKGERH